MDRFHLTAISIAWLLASGPASVSGCCEQIERPNILFILTDDQGWTTPSCYGNTLVRTPALDRIASEGMRFTDAYVTPQCTPTRASLLTGQHTARNGMWHVIGWYGTPWAPIREPAFRLQLLPQQCRLPHQLKQAGYATGMGGKWHLTNSEHGHYVYLKQKSACLFGFDEVAPAGPGSQNDGDKWVDHLTDCAIDFIERHQSEPWFYYLSHHTLHNRVTAPDALVRRYARQGAPETGLHNATYLAAIEHLDHSVGRLLEKLDELNLSRRTVVVFLSDNGGIDTSFNLPQWDDAPLDGSHPLTTKERQFDNAPLREGKGSVYEGGIRVPCLVRWPGEVPAGVTSEVPIHVVDWLPTLLSIAGQPVPDREAEDGVDLTPVLRGGSIPPRALYWYMPLYDLRWKSTPAAVIREGDFKLIEYFGDWYDARHAYHLGQRTELYNLKQDLSEQHNLAQTKPEVARQLRKKLLDWIASVPAEIPTMNPHHDGRRSLLETKERPSWSLPYVAPSGDQTPRPPSPNHPPG
ncbi:MAG: sulfatase [Planctomycetaceae bacterium]|nr:sulfatase [Planctomycetaceae bacterium]